MRPVIVTVIGLAALAGYLHLRSPDHTHAFVRCLQQRGGTLVDRPVRLRGRAEEGPSVGFAGLAYDSVVADGRALVFVSPADGPSTPAGLLRAARAGHAPARALVLMPPARDPEEQIGGCEERADPGVDYL